MGLGRAFLVDLIELKRCGALDGFKRVVEIGAQQLSDSLIGADVLAELYGLFGKQPADLGEPIGDKDFAKHAPSSRVFWQSLGFDYSAIDLTAANDAIPLDLNRDGVPPDWLGRFDLVVNAGTTEHAANQDNAFRIIHDLARKGGLMLHEVPASMFGHGLINYSPKFFVQLLRQNGYQPVFIRACRGDPEPVQTYIKAMNRRWGNGHTMDMSDLPSVTIRAAMVKASTAAFVTPLDLPRAMMLKTYLKSPRGWKHLLPLR